MSIFTPPTHGSGPDEIGPGARFVGNLLNTTFRKIRAVLNATVGSHGRPFGGNVSVDKESIGAISVQPGEITEVIRSDPNKVADKNYLHLERNFSILGVNYYYYPWDNNNFYPSGSSVTVTPNVDCDALFMGTLALSSSYNEHVHEQVGYTNHRTSQKFRVLIRENGNSLVTPTPFGAPGIRYVSMDGLGSLGDTRQASSLTHIGVAHLEAGNTYDFYGVLTTGLTQSPALVPANSEVVVQQLLGNGSSITVVLLKA